MLPVERLKFPIEPLVKQMLDQLPDEVWTSKKSTFLDPAMAGGQFLVEIERRLRAAGHSDKNISERVWGCETNIVRVNYARNNKKLVAKNLFISNFLDYNWGTMKFDVIVGNPPYQSSDSSLNLWPLFVEKSFDMLKPNGFLGMVTPATWMRPSNDIKRSKKEGGSRQIFADFMQPYQTKMVDCGTAKKYFSVGSTITWYVIQNKAADTKTTIVDHTGLTTQVDLRNFGVFPLAADVLTIEIFERLQAPGDKFNFKGIRGAGREDLEHQAKKNREYRYLYVGGQYSQKNFNEDLGCVTWWSRVPHPDFNRPKIIINYIGDIHPYVDDGNAGMQYCQVHFLDNKKQVASASSVVNSKLWRYAYKFVRFGMHNEAGVLNSFGVPPLDRVYTDQDLYQFYGLSQHQIEKIEKIFG